MSLSSSSSSSPSLMKDQDHGKLTRGAEQNQAKQDQVEENPMEVDVIRGNESTPLSPPSVIAFFPHNDNDDEDDATLTSELSSVVTRTVKNSNPTEEGTPDVAVSRCTREKYTGAVSSTRSDFILVSQLENDKDDDKKKNENKDEDATPFPGTPLSLQPSMVDTSILLAAAAAAAIEIPSNDDDDDDDDEEEECDGDQVELAKEAVLKSAPVVTTEAPPKDRTLRWKRMRNTDGDYNDDHVLNMASKGEDDNFQQKGERRKCDEAKKQGDEGQQDEVPKESDTDNISPQQVDERRNRAQHEASRRGFGRIKTLLLLMLLQFVAFLIAKPFVSHLSLLSDEKVAWNMDATQETLPEEEEEAEENREAIVEMDKDVVDGKLGSACGDSPFRHADFLDTDPHWLAVVSLQEEELTPVTTEHEAPAATAIDMTSMNETHNDVGNGWSRNTAARDVVKETDDDESIMDDDGHSAARLDVGADDWRGAWIVVLVWLSTTYGLFRLRTHDEDTGNDFAFSRPSSSLSSSPKSPRARIMKHHDSSLILQSRFKVEIVNRFGACVEVTRSGRLREAHRAK